MKFRYYDKVKGIMCSPDSADEWMEAIYEYGCDYDGESDVEGLQGLVDELIDCSHEARKCLKEGKLFRNEEAEEKSLQAAIEEQNRHSSWKAYYCPICDQTRRVWSHLDHDYCPKCRHRVTLKQAPPIFGYCKHCDFTFLHRSPEEQIICPICGQAAEEKDNWKEFFKAVKETDSDTAEKVVFDTV